MRAASLLRTKRSFSWSNAREGITITDCRVCTHGDGDEEGRDRRSRENSAARLTAAVMYGNETNTKNCSSVKSSKWKVCKRRASSPRAAECPVPSNVQRRDRTTPSPPLFRQGPSETGININNSTSRTVWAVVLRDII